jgi:hypothetical protein
VDEPNFQNPHDKFYRATIGNPLYAPDFLRNYADPVVAENVDLEHLRSAPTHQSTENLKEIIGDVSFFARLRDEIGNSDVLMFLEHKSKPSRFVPLQLAAQMIVTLYSGFTAAKYAETYEPPLPIAILIHNGKRKIRSEMFFQKIFRNIPKNWVQLIMQFKVLVIDFNQYDYGHLPGNPATQAIVESMKRATDGTFLTQLPSVIGHVRDAEYGWEQTLDLLKMIGSYCAHVTRAEKEQIFQSITKVFEGKKGEQMASIIGKSILEEGYKLGHIEGRIEGRIENEIHCLLLLLSKNFGKVPESLENRLKKINNLDQLEKLLIFAFDCQSIEEFEKELK